MLGSMLAVPCCETVIGLVLLAHIALGNDAESEEWMFAGMAVRMAIDLGLHLVCDFHWLMVECRGQLER
jgi:hypothetical protein